MPQRRGGRGRKREARAARPERNLSEWAPKTKLGRLVLAGELTTLGDAIRTGLPIREPEIVDVLLPETEDEVLDVNMVQRMTDSGRRVNYAIATFAALRQTGQVKVRSEQTERLKIKAGAEQVFTRKIEAPPVVAEGPPPGELPEEIAVEGEALTEEPAGEPKDEEAPEE